MKRKHQEGLTLIELMISSMIMTIVLLSCMYVLFMAQRISEESRQRLLALNAARSVMEVIKDTPIAAVPAINTAAYVPAELQNGAIAITTNPANVAAVNLATVTINVTWIGAGNRPQSLTFTTQRSSYI